MHGLGTVCIQTFWQIFAKRSNIMALILSSREFAVLGESMYNNPKLFQKIIHYIPNVVKLYSRIRPSPYCVKPRTLTVYSDLRVKYGTTISLSLLVKVKFNFLFLPINTNLYPSKTP